MQTQLSPGSSTKETRLPPSSKMWWGDSTESAPWSVVSDIFPNFPFHFPSWPWGAEFALIGPCCDRQPEAPCNRTAKKINPLSLQWRLPNTIKFLSLSDRKVTLLKTFWTAYPIWFNASKNKCYSQIWLSTKNYCFFSKLISLVPSSVPGNYSVAVFMSPPGLFCLCFSPGIFCSLCVLLCLFFHSSSSFSVWHLSLPFCVLLSLTPAVLHTSMPFNTQNSFSRDEQTFLLLNSADLL